MPQIFVPFVNVDKPVEIIGENAKYLLTVLRMNPGDTLTVVDRMGGRHKVEIWQTMRREAAYGKVLESYPAEPEPETGIVLFQGMLKGQKMDLVVQKATELGVKEIVPLVTERTQVKETRKAERWRKIAEESSKLSGGMPPHVGEPLDIKKIGSVYKEKLNGFIFWEEGGAPLKEAFASAFSSMPEKGRYIYITIGPEGGFTEDEVGLANEAGLTVTTLGRRILKAETAAISAVALVRFLLGEGS